MQNRAKVVSNFVEHMMFRLDSVRHELSQVPQWDRSELEPVFNLEISHLCIVLRKYGVPIRKLFEVKEK